MSSGSEDDGDFSTDWDIEQYHTDHETDEHWQIKKLFMESHKTRFPEQRLVCLAQVFANMEFLGCKYPEKTMRTVAELSKDLAKEFRDIRSGRLKRTFVSASDAAESRAKGRRKTQHQLEGQQPSTSKSSADAGCKPPPTKRSVRVDLFDSLRYGTFVLYLIGGRNCLRISAGRCNMEFEEKEVSLPNQKRKIEVYLNKELIAFAVAENIKSTKAEAFTKALDILQTHCYSIQPKPLRDTIKVDKAGDKVVCDVTKQCLDTAEEKKLDATNKGYKMLKMMGWTGGGLGSTTQGRIDPVGYLFKNNRAGLGNDACKLDRKYFTQMLQNYIDSEDIRELQFESSFTKDERAMLHEIAGKLSLKSSSYGKGDDRRLIISKRNITNETILTEILENNNPSYADLYSVQVPETKFQQYPEYTAKLELLHGNTMTSKET